MYRNQVRRSRVLAAVLAVAVSAAGCVGGTGPSASSAKPSPSFDRSTVRACGHAAKAVELDGDASFRATRSALASAALSDVPTLRQIAERQAPDGTTAGNIRAQTGAIQIQTWCLDHGLAE